MLVWFNLDRVAAFRAGVSTSGHTTTLEIDPAKLSDEDHELLASRLNQRGDVCGRDKDGYFNNGYYGLSSAPDGDRDRNRGQVVRLVTAKLPTQEALFDAIRQEEAEIAKTKADKEAEKAEKKAVIRERTLIVLRERKTSEHRRFAAPDGNPQGYEVRGGVRCDKVSAGWAYDSDDEVRQSDEAKAWEAELAARNKAEFAQAVEKAKAKLAKLEQSDAVAAVAKEAGKAKLLAWAKENGSELLKARIEDGFTWEGLAEAEYADATIAKLQLGLEVADAPNNHESEVKERTTPTLEEINILRAANKRIEDSDVEVEAELVWVAYTPKASDYPDDEGDEPIKRCELRITVTCTNGATEERYFLPALVQVTS